MTKLSTAQKALLDEMKAKGSITAIDTYKTMAKLVELGLATKTIQGRFGHSTFELTEAGKAHP